MELVGVMAAGSTTSRYRGFLWIFHPGTGLSFLVIQISTGLRQRSISAKPMCVSCTDWKAGFF